jgi:hypothetical protein
MFSKRRNYGWSVKKIKKLIMREDKFVSEDEAEIRAKEIYQELNRLNKNMYNNSKCYFDHNIPLSMFDWGENRI